MKREREAKANPMSDKNRNLGDISLSLRVLVFAVLFSASNLFAYIEAESQAATAEQIPLPSDITAAPAPSVAVPQREVDQATIGNAAVVTMQTPAVAHPLFERAPLEWNTATISFILGWAVSLPQLVPEFLRFIMEKSVVLGLLGAVILALWITSLLYRLAGRNKIFKRFKEEILPLLDRMPRMFRVLIVLLVQTVIASLLPLLLLGAVSLIGQFLPSEDPWFRLAREILGLWAMGSLGIHLLRGVLAGDVLLSCPIYGQEIFQFLRLALVYALMVIGLERVAQAFQIRGDVLAFLWFATRLSIVLVFFLFFLKKHSFLSLLPKLPYRSYGAFVRFLDRFYFLLIGLSAAVGILMCLGYKNFAGAFFTRTWAVAVAYVAISAAYHYFGVSLQKWSESRSSDAAAQHFFRSAKSLLRYVALVIGALVILTLLGLLDPLQQIMSFPVLTVGGTPLSFWVFVRAALVVLAFMYVSQLLQTYLDYQLYPSLGIETGLAYALNSLLKYLFIITGLLIALRFVGVDLRVLMVLAGTAGIGIGFGLQSIVANMTSGLIIIFGRKLRKGDWVHVGDTVGVVSDIYLRATKVQTRDNIEYVIPNSEFISKTIVNYTLTSPFIRVHIPVGVSYEADPQEVTKILLACAEKEPGVSRYDKPKVWFAALGDSSINFDLLVWTDIRRFSQKEIRSRLNFQIFEALRNSGIEIPFPQREIRIRPPLDVPPASMHPDDEIGG